MQIMGLSTHNNQLEKRKSKYPNHFVNQDNKYFITKQYAAFIVLNEMINHVSTTLNTQLMEGGIDA
jgi:hypothetical protein